MKPKLNCAAGNKAVGRRGDGSKALAKLVTIQKPSVVAAQSLVKKYKRMSQSPSVQIQRYLAEQQQRVMAFGQTLTGEGTRDGRVPFAVSLKPKSLVDTFSKEPIVAITPRKTRSGRVYGKTRRSTLVGFVLPHVPLPTSAPAPDSDSTPKKPAAPRPPAPVAVVPVLPPIDFDAANSSNLSDETADELRALSISPDAATTITPKLLVPENPLPSQEELVTPVFAGFQGFSTLMPAGNDIKPSEGSSGSPEKSTTAPVTAPAPQEPEASVMIIEATPVTSCQTPAIATPSSDVQVPESEKISAVESKVAPVKSRRRNSIFPRQAIRAAMFSAVATCSDGDDSNLGTPEVSTETVEDSPAVQEGSAMEVDEVVEPRVNNVTQRKPPKRRRSGRWQQTAKRRSIFVECEPTVSVAPSNSAETTSQASTFEATKTIDGKVFVSIKLPKTKKKLRIPETLEINPSLLVEPSISCLRPSDSRQRWDGQKHFRWADDASSGSLTEVKEFENEYLFRQTTYRKSFFEPSPY